MKMRKLSLKDTPLMLEWMHDNNVVEYLSANFAAKELSDCEAFIVASTDESETLHRAIVNDEDEYMGTVSLKHIDLEIGNAEFAITIRKSAMGQGYSWYGMVEILRIAFEELNLGCVYWCVSRKNERACRFYDKHGFHEALNISNGILARYEGLDNLKWYSALNGDDYQNEVIAQGEVVGYKIIKIKTIPTLNSGELSFFEANHDIPFDIRRIYYISKVPEGVSRGFHAHKELKQLLFCPYGIIRLILDDGKRRKKITLSDPSVGIVIEKPIWREMLWMKKNSILCVAASDYYNDKDYIRDYRQFLEYIEINQDKGL